jgi:hypothetical protein
MKHLLRDADAAFYTTGKGLRGVPVIVMDRDTGELIWSRVHSNNAKYLYLDVPLSRDPDQYDAYLLGSVPVTLESGDLTFGDPRAMKSLKYLTVEYERNSTGSAAFFLATDTGPQVTASTPWRRIGRISFTGTGKCRLPIINSASNGRTFRYIIHALDPSQAFVITHLSFDFEIDDDF